MSQALYRKWRPSQWEQVVGQEHIIQTLRNQITAGRTGHAYLFAGPRGTGKTTTARLLAKALNCTHSELSGRPCDTCPTCLEINRGSYLDLIEIDAASNTSVEDVRDLRDKIGFTPNNPQGFKVYIIDEVHMLSTAAFNALLKTLEEPPPHAIFILATTDIGKIPATILSRCQRHEFRRLSVAEIVSQLQKISIQENLKVEEDALRVIARQATGAMRDAISLLDQLASGGEVVDISKTMQVLGTARSDVARDLVDAILTRDSAAGLHTIQEALDTGADSRQLSRQVVDYLRGLLLVRLGSGDQVDATVEMRQEMARQASALGEGRILEILPLFNSAAFLERSTNWHPALQLEMAFAGALAGAQAGPPAPPRLASSPAAYSPAQVSPTQAPTARPTVPSPAAQVSPAGPAQGEKPSSRTHQEQGSTSQGAEKPSGRTSQEQGFAGQGRSAPPAQLVAAAKKPPAPAQSAAPANKLAEPTQPVPAAQSAEAAQLEPAQDTEAARSMFQTIVQSWPKVRALVKRQSPQTEALLNSGRLLGVKDGALVVALSPVLKTKLESEGRLEITVRAIQTITGMNITVRCTDTANRPGGLPSNVQVEDDGIVGTALRDLGGEVVDIQ